jgi:protein ImuB
MVQAKQGQPTEISAWDKNKSVYGKVVCLAGPWRTTGDWWRTDTWARDEWDVAIASRSQKSEVRSQKEEVWEINEIGGKAALPEQVLYRIYRELSNGSWFVEGVYD